MILPTASPISSYSAYSCKVIKGEPKYHHSTSTTTPKDKSSILNKGDSDYRYCAQRRFFHSKVN